MEEIAPRKMFSLYLNTNTGFRNLINNTSTADVTWLVDYDSLFNRENYKYKNCNVRVRLVGETNLTQDTSNTSGVLVANFGQSYTGKNVAGLVLAPIDLTRSIIYSGGTFVNGNAYIDINTTTNALGQTIDMPRGITQLNLQMFRNGYGAAGDAENIPVTNTVPYYVIFHFELF